MDKKKSERKSESQGEGDIESERERREIGKTFKAVCAAEPRFQGDK